MVSLDKLSRQYPLVRNRYMTGPSLPFSFESLGTEIDRIITGLSTHATERLPFSEETKNTIKSVIPKFAGEIYVDITENETQFIVTCDIPGVEKENIAIRLLNPTTLLIKITADEVIETGEEENYYLRERKVRSGERSITFPSKVTAEGAKATFRNGIMELILPKCEPEEGIRIDIE